MASASGEVIERILAVVDGRPVMLTEVEVVGRIRGLDRKTAVLAAIDERLMFQEASRLPQAAVSPEDEEWAYRSLAQKAPPGAAAEADLRRLARRQTAILKYVEFRFRPQVRVSEAAVREAYDAENVGREGAPPFEAAAAAIRERLERRDLDEKIEAWIADLRSSAEVRLNGQAPGPDGAQP